MSEPLFKTVMTRKILDTFYGVVRVLSNYPGAYYAGPLKSDETPVTTEAEYYHSDFGDAFRALLEFRPKRS